MNTYKIKNLIYKLKNKIIKKNHYKFNLSKELKYHFIAVLIISTVLLPFRDIVFGSFYSTVRSYVDGNIIFTLYNFVAVLQNKPFFRSIINSAIISGGTTLLSITVSIFASYALSRLKIKFKKHMEIGLYSLQMFPSITFVVPFFILFIYIKKFLYIPMQNTYHGLIITYTSFSLPFSILMLKNYMESIPKEIEEQAKIDGCSKMKMIIRIFIPLSFPAIITVAIYSFLMSWNELLFAYTLSKIETYPVSVMLTRNIFDNTFQWCAAALIVTVPIVIIFAFLQKKMIQGLGNTILK